MPRLPRLPDLLTTANLCCGVAAILFASQGQVPLACWLIFLAAVFDVFDGLAARALGGGSPLGTQLDSLADMVSFGVAPAFLLFVQASTLAGNLIDPSALAGWSELPYPNLKPNWPIKVAAVALAVASCWRLAKFNLDTRQTSGFLGLPTPANGLFWASLCLASPTNWRAFDMPAKLLPMVLAAPFLTLVVALLMSFLMLSEIPLPSLKFKNMGWKGNEVIYLLLGSGLVLVLLYGMLAVPLILVLYLLSPLWGKLFPTKA
ncbi:MAG TPA: CDP-alcohol phosphatidyltransferase family protein [Flavobacteriales bacterium]|nr:CDP-alcohol phosphatidyltransferase family protein [Flavobacteriales bacterium]